MFLVLTIDPGGEEQVHAALGEVTARVRAIGFRTPHKNLTLVLGIGSAAWDRLFTGPRPRELHEFVALDGPHHAPSTPGDLLLHVRADTMDVCFQLADQLLGLLGAVHVVDEVHGFRYYDNRDLLGFVDGTENPTGAEAAAATVIDAGDPEFAGSSYVMVQRYVHDMAAWNATPVGEQERVIGRTKLDDLELDERVKPSNAHNALNLVEDENGVERAILRANMPFGALGSGTYGTYYIAYCATPAVPERMLRNMFLGDPPGNTDRILDFSTAETGALFLVPTIEFLNDPPALPAGGAAAPAPSPEAPTSTSGSLGIGSLKGI